MNAREQAQQSLDKLKDHHAAVEWLSGHVYLFLSTHSLPRDLFFESIAEESFAQGCYIAGKKMFNAGNYESVHWFEQKASERRTILNDKISAFKDSVLAKQVQETTDDA